MATTIHKQSIDLLNSIEANDQVRLRLPAFAEVLSIQQQSPGSSTVEVWYRCATDMPLEDRTFWVIGTGHPAPPKNKARFVSTVLLQDGALVLHFFEEAA